MWLTVEDNLNKLTRRASGAATASSSCAAAPSRRRPSRQAAAPAATAPQLKGRQPMGNSNALVGTPPSHPCRPPSESDPVLGAARERF
jgi:hypothetical protein